MKIRIGSSCLRRLSDEAGTSLILTAMLMVVFCGLAGLTVDLGRAYAIHRELQSSTDAATLAGAYEMSQSGATATSVSAEVAAYSAAQGGANAISTLPNVTVTTTLTCLSTLVAKGVPCVGSPTGNNSLQVQQTYHMPTTFIRVLGVVGIQTDSAVPITTTSTAAMKGSLNERYNVAIIIDTTNSMTQNDTDAACGHTRIYCALQGVRTLLQNLSPCTPSSTSSSCTPFDQVSLFTYPNVQANQASQDSTCPTSVPTILNYSLPSATAPWSAPTGTAPTYQITNYVSDYSATNQPNGGLRSTSPLTQAAGGKSGCSGMQAKGGVGTYFAGAIYAAQASLIAAQATNPNSLNALIILSDGDANSNAKITGSQKNGGTAYGSAQDLCQQAVTAAQAAALAGTRVYTVAYGAASSGCNTDTTGPLAGISPCSTMQRMASSPAYFYSDANASQNPGQCISPDEPSLDLNGIFVRIQLQLTQVHLIPDKTT